MVRRLEKKKLCTLGDLWRCYSLKAPGEIAAELTRLAPSREITRKMLAELEAAGKTWVALSAYAQQHDWLGPRGWRDKRTLVASDADRQYIVQEHVKQLYVRIPVGVLGVVRGEILDVRFNPSSVVVRKSAG